MGNRRAGTQGRHRAHKPESGKRGVRRAKAAVSAIGMAGVAVAGAALLGTAPTMSVSPQLLATLHYLRGTNIGYQPTQQEYEDFIGVVVNGTAAPKPDAPYEKVDYNAGFRPFSHGGFKDLTFDDSVAQGVANLAAAQPAPGDIIFGFSQGAAVASQYKADHTGNTYVLVANPNRPNGGILERFEGLHIPFLDVTFNGATPDNGDYTIDVARQYDGWTDFPTYLWNPVAIANAVVGMALVHGNTQFQLTEADLEAARNSGDSDYYQFDAKSNTAYYVVKTYPIPLLIPLDPFLPDPVIAALDAPLRKFIETAYNRDDYSVPTRATLFPRRQATAAVESVDEPAVAPAQQRSAPDPEPQVSEEPQEPAAKRTAWHPRKHLRAVADDESASDTTDTDATGSSTTTKTETETDAPAKADNAPTTEHSAAAAGSGADQAAS
ncbi:putative PPE family protein PPE42 [Mycolicibacterium chlorophenolicum]|uniref:Putative PPE family protein PPE42 n=1 Tax=Mycolicibacterium chlorophenolicum TaxID=37916 RepID=A0A0J6W3H2_9MYCO|nr:putative PPE family protein PPE42 [Mycolicibacterium chlorophenolicum]